LDEPLENAVAMGIAYVIGSLIPMLPYAGLRVVTAMPVSIAGTMLTLFTSGALKGRVVKQDWWRSGIAMLSIAGLAGSGGVSHRAGGGLVAALRGRVSSAEPLRHRFARQDLASRRPMGAPKGPV